jgi:hypothetical protein
VGFGIGVVLFVGVWNISAESVGTEQGQRWTSTEVGADAAVVVVAAVGVDDVIGMRRHSWLEWLSWWL